MDLPKAIKFKRVSKNIVKTRHAVAEEFMEEEDDDSFLPEKFYVIRADTRVSRLKLISSLGNIW